MFSDRVLSFVACLPEVFVLTLFMLLDSEAVEAYGQDADAMVACVKQVTWDELVVDDVVEALAAVKVFKVRAHLT